MPETLASDIAPSGIPRRVLLWLADGDESLIKSDIQQTGEFLGVSPEAVTAAIISGEPLNGWFVDWEAVRENS